MPTERPTLAWVTALKTERRDSVFGALHAEMLKDQEFLEAGNQLGRALMKPYLRSFPEDFVERVLPIARLAALYFAIALNNGEPPTIKVFLDERAGVQNREAVKEEIRTWLAAWLAKERASWFDVAKNIGAYGVGPVYYAVDASRLPAEPSDPDLRDDWEVKRRNATCVDVRAVHPAHVYWDTASQPPKDCLFVEQISAREAYEAYGLELGGSDTGEKRDYERVVYVSADWIAGWVDEQPVMGADGVVENRWGRMPAGIAESGMGFASSTGDLVHQIQGAIRHGRDVIASAMVKFNTYELQMASGGMPAVEVSGSTQEQRTKVKQNLRVGPGAINDLGGEDTAGAVTITYGDTPDLPRFDAQHADVIDRWLQLVYGPNMMRGLPTTENATVNAQNQVLAEALYSIARANYNGLVSTACMDVLHMLRADMESTQSVFQEDAESESGCVELHAANLPARGLRVVVDMTPQSLVERRANQEADTQLRDALGLDDEWLAERQGVENFREVQRRSRIGKLLEGLGPMMIDTIRGIVEQQLPQRLDTVRNKAVDQGVLEPVAPGGGAAGAAGATGNGRVPLGMVL